jgi:hypothetical protein
MKSRAIAILLFLVILTTGAFFRYIDNRWDSGYYLHPDERFLTMVGAAMTEPPSFGAYLEPAVSTFNPVNIGYEFFVYGTFPLILNKLIAMQVGAEDYSYFGLLGRVVSATFDLITLILVFRITGLFARYAGWSIRAQYLATFFYAISVMPIQLSHFFAVDTFMTTFMMASLYFALRYRYGGNPAYVAASAVALGLAGACKASAIFIAPVIVAIICLGVVRSNVGEQHDGKGHNPAKPAGSSPGDVSTGNPTLAFLTGLLGSYRRPYAIVTFLGLMVMFALFAYVSLRLANPYYFQTGNVLDPTPNEQWLKSVHDLKSFEGIDVWFPPAVQWMTKPPVTFALQNIAVFGIGIPYFLLAMSGLYFVFRRYRTPETTVIFIWMVLFFLHQSVQFVKVMRYFVFIYPLLAMLAGLGTVALADIFATRIRKGGTKHASEERATSNDARAAMERRWLGAAGAMVAASFIWPLMFLNIYLKDHSRITASQWMYDTLPDGSYILSEHWDDPLPLLLPTSNGKSFPGEQLEVFGEDTDAKFEKMREQMNMGDYYVLSSNRAWGSMPTVPQKYPRMGPFYEDLFAGRLGYRTIQVFTVYPSLEWMGIPLTLPDDWADESFTVYDHPKVIIMENTRK